MSVTYATGSAIGQNRPLVSGDGTAVVAGNGVSNLCAPATPNVVTPLVGASPPAPNYAMGWFAAGPVTIEVVSAAQATVWQWSMGLGRLVRTPIAMGPFGGNQTYASGGHWSTLGGPLGICVDGVAYTPALPYSGWVQGGQFAVYQKADFSGLVVEDIETHQATVLAPPPGASYWDNAYSVVEINGEPYVTCTAGGKSWLWQSSWFAPLAVNLPANVSAGVFESTAQVVRNANGILWLCTWNASMQCYLRPLGSSQCVNLAMPGQAMQLAATPTGCTVIGTDQDYHLWTALVPADEPLVDPIGPSPTPPDPTPPPQPLTVRATRCWEFWWKSETPPSQYGRWDSPSNAILLEGSVNLLPDGTVEPVPCPRFDPALHTGKAIVCNDETAGVPDWDGTTGLVGGYGSVESADRLPSNRDLLTATLRGIYQTCLAAVRRRVPVFLNIDALHWMEPAGLWLLEMVESIETQTGAEIVLMDEFYPRKSELDMADTIARFRAVAEWHHARGRRYGITTTAYTQSGNYPVGRIQRLQLPMSDLLAEFGEHLLFLGHFSLLRASGALWTTAPDGSKPLADLPPRWAVTNPPGDNPIVWLHPLPLPPGDTDMAILDCEGIFLGELNAAYQVVYHRPATAGDLDFQLKRFRGQFPGESWPPARILCDILSKKWPGLTQADCELKAVSQIVREHL